MFGKPAGAMTLLALLSLTFIACTKPKYETVVNSVGGGKIEKVSECALRFSTTGYCILWSWEKFPSAKEAGVLALKVVRSNLLDDSPVLVELEPAPSVLLWMPEMGHGSVPTKVEKIDQGSFRVSNVFFIMPGTWEIRIQIKNGDEILDEAIMDYTL